MSKLRLFTDEDVYAAVAKQLRNAGFDVVSTPEAGRLGQNDASQLQWAAEQQRTLVSFNVSDLARLHHEWMTQGKHHHGIVVSKQRPVGEVISRLIHLGQALSAEDMKNRLEYLTNW